MKAIILSLLFSISGLTNTIGQTNLTSDEILKHWIETEKPFINDSLIHTQFDNTLDIRINKVIDSLKKENVDSIIVYASAYPGYEGSNKCKSGLFPTYTYIIWKSGVETNIQKIEGNCTFKVVRLNSTEIFQYYEKNYMRLNSEFFMPVILSGQKDKKQEISFSRRYVDHEPNYCIYYSIKSKERTFKFSESEMEDKESLFIHHNQNLAAIQWWQTIKKHTTDVKGW